MALSDTQQENILKYLKLLWHNSERRWSALDQADQGNNTYRCQHCQNIFPYKQVQVDHLQPMGTFESFDSYIEALFVSDDQLQILCKSCHQDKSREEFFARKAQKLHLPIEIIRQSYGK